MSMFTMSWLGDESHGLPQAARPVSFVRKGAGLPPVSNRLPHVQGASRWVCEAGQAHARVVGLLCETSVQAASIKHTAKHPKQKKYAGKQGP